MTNTTVLRLSLACLFAFVPLQASKNATHTDAQSSSNATIGSSIQPMVIVGEGWSQQFTITNVSYYDPEPTVGRIKFYDTGGKPWKIPVRGRGLVDSIPVQLNPGRMIVFETEVSFEPQKLGWAYFDLSDNINEWGTYRAFTTYRKQTPGSPDLMTSIPFVDDLESDWVIPVDNAEGCYQGIAIVNRSSSRTALYHFDVFNEQGNLIRSFTKSVPPMGMNWFSLTGDYPDLAGLRGQLRINGDLLTSPAVLILKFTPNGAFTAVPVVHTFGM